MLESFIVSINHVDVALFYMINHGLQNAVFNVTMPILTNAGTDAFWLLVCVGIFIFGGEKGRDVAILGIIALLFGYVLTEFIKYEVARPRPFTALNNVHLLTTMTDHSFPSGHSVAAFTGCTLLGVKYGHLYIFLILAGVIAFSRVYIGVHYPLDVIFGSLVGVLCALIVLHFEENILKVKNKIFHKWVV
ncbi:putative undecaprenyl-diphosphatase YbjG [anaerobic digester metagenome]